MNGVVFDSDWEAEFCRVAEAHPRVLADTMTTQWVPGVSALGSYGRWAFAEFRSAHEIEADFDAFVKGAVGVAETA